MLGAPAEIGQLVGMAQSETPAAAYVAGVGGTGGITYTQRFRHGGITDDAGPAAISYRLIFLIPARNRKPHLNFDIRIAGGAQGSRDAAERGQIGKRIESLVLALGVPTAWGRELSRGDYLGRGNAGVGQ